MMAIYQNANQTEGLRRFSAWRPGKFVGVWTNQEMKSKALELLPIILDAPPQVSLCRVVILLKDFYYRENFQFRDQFKGLTHI